MKFSRQLCSLIVAMFVLAGIAVPESCNEGVQCGDEICGTDQFCQVTYPGVEGAPTTYSCANAPEECLPDDLNCECLVATDACPEFVAWCDDSETGPVCSIAMP